PLRSLSRVGDRVIAGQRFLQAAEDLVECIATNLSFAAGGEDEIALRVLTDDVLFEKLREERVEIDVRIDVAALLKQSHPPHRFFDVAAALQQQLIEEPAQSHLRQQATDEIGIQERISVASHRSED